MSDAAGPRPPAFYAAPWRPNRSRWADWWVLLHPPYTLWHLSYVAIGATIASRFDVGRLAATLLAFLLAVGVCAHAHEERHRRPLPTPNPSRLHLGAAARSLAGAVALGVIGLTRVGPGLAVFIAVGVALTLGYNLELLGGRLHTDVIFAAAWGAFPVLTAYYAQVETLRVPALLAAGAAFWLSTAQRSLSTPARMLRRRVAELDGTITFHDGGRASLSVPDVLAPLEHALKATAWGVTALAVALVVFRITLNP